MGLAELYHGTATIQRSWTHYIIHGPCFFFQFFYILDYFWQEESILTTMDIKHDPFGWMLCWGDLVWVPFSYSLQAFYLYNNPNVDVGIIPGVFIFALHFLGYRIFRESNNQTKA